jgi:hypothetical protein
LRRLPISTATLRVAAMVFYPSYERRPKVAERARELR